MSWVRSRPRALALLAAAGVLGAGASTLAGRAGAATVEPGGGSGSNCPASTYPNAMTLVAGTPQTATLNSAYATGLQVALTNTDGCAVTSGAAGVAVTFTAPSSGASGVFSASGTNTVTVGADSAGAVGAPTFTANEIAGSYTVTASSRYGSVSFALTNTAAGMPARIVAISPVKQTATVAGRYRQTLAVKVLDGDGNPVAGAGVTFTLTASTAASACGSSSSSSGAGSGADASFAGGASEASATSNAAGVAISPALTADGETGSFTASAALGSSGGSEPHSGASSSGSVTPAVFTLTNLAGAPAKLTPGVGATQSTRVDARFPVSLAVTVTDAQGNRVPGALVSFAAPAAGPSGRFSSRPASRSRRGRAHRTRVARVRTDACGVALAPALTADAEPGGYVVRASAGHARAAAFALVNEAP
jgi:protocatechuate 3,4-dioxygenase beta subunit